MSPSRTTSILTVVELRRAPVGVQPLQQLVAQRRGRHAHLLERVAVAQRDGVVLHRLAVDGDAPRRADLVLAAVALADRAALVELGRHQRCAAPRRSRAPSRACPSRDTSGSTATLTGASRGCRRSTRALAARHLLLVVGVDHERERAAVRAGRGLDHVRDVALLGGRVEVARGPCRRTRRGGVGRSRCGWRCPRARTSPSGTGTRCRSSRPSSARARPAPCSRSCRWSGRMPRSVYQRMRSSIQCWCHCSASAGGRRTRSPSARTRGCGR